MIAAAVASFYMHVHGAGFVAILIWWVVWARLWVVWIFNHGTWFAAAVSLGVFALMLFGPRTHLGFHLQQNCLNDKAQAALAAHSNGAGLGELGDYRCGLMTFTLETQLMGIEEIPWNGDKDARRPVAVLRNAGEAPVTLDEVYGLMYSPAGEPLCGDYSNISCFTNQIGSTDWYYYWSPWRYGTD